MTYTPSPDELGQGRKCNRLEELPSIRRQPRRRRGCRIAPWVFAASVIRTPFAAGVAGAGLLSLRPIRRSRKHPRVSPVPKFLPPRTTRLAVMTVPAHRNNQGGPKRPPATVPQLGCSRDAA